MNLDPSTRTSLFEFLLRLGDDRLLLGHRLSEWCGHAPVLEEDIALTNIALDEIGQATAFLHLAGEVEAKHRTEDDLAYFREATKFRNVQLVEQPNGDFAWTISRQFFFDVYNYLLLGELQKSAYLHLAGIAAKGFKEATYHVRHSKEWMVRLGDGTEESHRRVQDAVNNLWRFTGELFLFDEIEQRLSAQGMIPSLENLQVGWNEIVAPVLTSAMLVHPPKEMRPVSGSRKGKHSEHLGHVLAEMQILARSYPDAKW